MILRSPFNMEFCSSAVWWSGFLLFTSSGIDRRRSGSDPHNNPGEDLTDRKGRVTTPGTRVKRHRGARCGRVVVAMLAGACSLPEPG